METTIFTLTPGVCPVSGESPPFFQCDVVAYSIDFYLFIPSPRTFLSLTVKRVPMFPTFWNCAVAVGARFSLRKYTSVLPPPGAL